MKKYSWHESGMVQKADGQYVLVGHADKLEKEIDQLCAMLTLAEAQRDRLVKQLQEKR